MLASGCRFLFTSDSRMVWSCCDSCSEHSLYIWVIFLARIMLDSNPSEYRITCRERGRERERGERE
ncbi:hypothetical protein EYF80_046923 [Liparis tanakae]|uniref:Uncharacterized protein n=1 Tax=Liparis tanakae TaxID=230148 RepID=A0A4Z2FNS3_9TELE|nr:hypothetical protein EYF80_046923 [Liparis tanakae]